MSVSCQVTLGCELFRAAGAGDVALVRDLLEEGADPLLRHAGGQRRPQAPLPLSNAFEISSRSAYPLQRLPLHVAHGAPVARGPASQGQSKISTRQALPFK